MWSVLRIRRLLLGLLLIGGPQSAFASGGGIYKYTEADGTIVYTNVRPSGSVRARRVAGTFSAAPRATEPAAARPSAAAEFERHIVEAARRHRLPEALVRAVMHAESNFNPLAISPKGAIGLMQLMPDTAREMFVKDPLAPRDNIEGGARYLRVLANLYQGDMVKMIAAYNAGPYAVRKYGGKVPPYEETQAYVRKVLELYFQYKGQAESGQAALGRDRNES